MKNLYKLLVTDIDGTIVDHGSRGEEIGVDHPVKIAIKHAQEMGKIVTFASGRNYYKAKFIIDAFGIIDPVIINGGSQIVNPTNGLVLWEKCLNKETAIKIIEYISSIGTDNGLLIGFGNQEEKPFSSMVSSDLDGLVYLDIIGISDKSKVEKIIKQVDILLNAKAVFTLSPQISGRFNVNITDSNATKSHALCELQKILSITKLETIAMGDGNNDLPLFEGGGLKVAVDNADSIMKNAADIVVPSFHEHGISQVINKYLIGGN